MEEKVSLLRILRAFRRLPGGNKIPHLFHEIRSRKRLCDCCVHPAGYNLGMRWRTLQPTSTDLDTWISTDLLNLLASGICSHCNDGNIDVPPSDLSGTFDTSHYRHLDICGIIGSAIRLPRKGSVDIPINMQSRGDLPSTT